MAKYELKLPKMGESVAEATITTWLKSVGDKIEVDDTVVEIATDKVDSEVPSDVEGVLTEILFNDNEVVAVGQTIAIIETDVSSTHVNEVKEDLNTEVSLEEAVEEVSKVFDQVKSVTASTIQNSEERFYSPLVKNIANQENIQQEELDLIKGSGASGRVTKSDILNYIENRGSVVKAESKQDLPLTKEPLATINNGEDEIVEMSRMEKLISKHMTNSLQTSAHVQSFIEADVTNVWKWRAKVKDEFFKREGEKLTFTPIFMEVVAKALRDFPLLNISIDGDKIIKKKAINVGMATALPDGNLIVPVIKNADQLNLVGMAKKVNDLASRARNNNLNPDDIQGGTYTVTNVGSFGSIMGTPIINQPEVGILAIGAIRKTPSVIETPEGDFIGIRYKMFLSHSYDHRVVNGALGGMFVKAVKDYLENWDINRVI